MAETQEAACTALLVMIRGHRNLDGTVMAAMQTIGKGMSIARTTFLRKLRSVMPRALILAISRPLDQVGPMDPTMVKAPWFLAHRLCRDQLMIVRLLPIEVMVQQNPTRDVIAFCF